jgi:hypothetical protein
MKTRHDSTLIDTIRYYRHEAHPLDYNLAFLLIFLTALVLVTPLTPGYRLFRQAIAGPAITIGWLYTAWVPYVRNDAEQWEVTILSSKSFRQSVVLAEQIVAQAFRALETFVFFPPEENVFRLREVRKEHESLEPTAQTQKPELVPEPVPQPFTLRKLYWGLSLFWSYRGIGWNYACPLPESSLQRPYSRNSSRREFLITRLRKTILIWFSWDLFRTYTNLTPASIYLSGRPGIAPSYANLAVGEKAIHSILIPARIVLDTERSFLMCSIMMVSIGGFMGWEGELWEPYGWPPLFGTFGDLWTSPGLATMWSKVCTGSHR